MTTEKISVSIAYTQNPFDIIVSGGPQDINYQHCGDCTFSSHSCLRCLYESQLDISAVVWRPENAYAIEKAFEIHDSCVGAIAWLKRNLYEGAARDLEEYMVKYLVV